MKRLLILPLAALAVLSTVSVQAATYTFTGTSGNAAWTGTNFTPNGVPGSSDTLVFLGASGALGVSGTTQSVLNIDASALTANQSILGNSGTGGATLTMSGTLSKATANSFTIRSTTTAPLSFFGNVIDLSLGSLNFGTSAAAPIKAFSATNVNISGGSLFFFTEDNATVSIGALNMSGGVVNMRNLTSGTTNLVVNSLSGTSGDIRLANSASGNGAQGTLIIDTTGSSSFSGQISDGLSSPLARLNLTKSGVGTQNLIAVSNNYSGVTTINGGVLGAMRLVNGGSSSSIGLSSNDAANLVINGGVLRYLGGGANTDRNFTLGVNGGGLEASGGSLNFTNTSAIVLAGTNTARTLALSGSSNGSLAGVLGDNGTGATSLVKTGTARWTLSGQNTYTGSTTISEGTLLLSAASNNIAGSALVTVASGATLNVASVSGFTLASGQTLAGSGTIVGDFTLGSGAILAPGNSPGTLTFDNNLTLLAGSTSNFEINGLTSGLYDLVQELGAQAVSFDGTLNLVFQAGFNTVGTVQIFDFSGYSGNFTVVNSSGLAGGYTATFDELTGVVTVVPEPSTMLLLGLGSGFVLWRLRRRLKS